MARTRPRSNGQDEAVGLEPLMDASKVIMAVVAHSIAQVGADVSMPQLRVLVMISARGAMNVSSVAQGLGVNPSNASRTCDRMVAAGLLTRRPDDRDRRHLVLELSADGAALLEGMLGERRADLEQVIRRMTPSQRRKLDDCMTAFVAAAQEVSRETGVQNAEGRLLNWLT